MVGRMRQGILIAGVFVAAGASAVAPVTTLAASPMIGFVAAAAPQAETVTGSWDFEIDVPGNPMPLHGEFTQKDKVFTGKVSSALGDHDVTGSIDGAAFKLSFVGSGGVSVSLTGTLKGDAISGKATMTGNDEEMDFTGKRTKK